MISKKVLIVSAIVVMITIIFSSCRTGYGCKGRSKYITGYKSSMGFGY